MKTADRSTSVTVAAGIPVRGGRLLLGLRAAHKKAFPGCWDVIGGHVEADETPEAAMRRELLEEIGIVVGACTWVETIELDDEAEERLKLFIYRVDGWTGGEPRLANEEHTELRWFHLESACNIPNLAAAAYVGLFRRLLAR